MNPIWPPRPWLLTCTAALLLSACSSAPTRIYTLYGVAPATPRIAYAGPPLRVDAVYFPPALDRIEIIRDVAPGQLRLSDTDHWSAPLGETARQALSADLVARLPLGKALYPRLPKPDGALGLIVDVLAFHTDGQSAELQVSWVVVSPAGQGTSQAAGQGATGSANSATLRSSGAAANAAATAQALSNLLAQLADRIVAGL
jgi:uncharacterized lipoprotein YmbA